MGSGSYVDLVVIKPKDDVQYLRTFDEANVKVSFNLLKNSSSQMLWSGRAAREVHLPQGSDGGALGESERYQGEASGGESGELPAIFLDLLWIFSGFPWDFFWISFKHSLTPVLKVGDKNHAYIVDSEVVRPIAMEVA